MISDIIKEFEEEFEPRNMCGNCVHLNFIKAFLTKALNRVLDDIPIYEIGEIPDPSNVLSYTKELIEHINNYRK